MGIVAVIGAGSVGRALGKGLESIGTRVVFGVRAPGDDRYHALGAVDTPSGACARASMAVLAVPAASVPDAVPTLGLRPGQVVVDATNAVRGPIPNGHPTMGDLVASLVPDGVAVAKAFNTIGAEHLGNGRFGATRAFLPVAGDAAAVEALLPLATALGFDAVEIGGREAFAMVEEHARLWIHLALACGWGRDFGFAVVRR